MMPPTLAYALGLRPNLYDTTLTSVQIVGLPPATGTTPLAATVHLPSCPVANEKTWTMYQRRRRYLQRSDGSFHELEQSSLDSGTS